LQQLNACGLNSDEPVVLQSARSELYQQALDGLIGRGLAYPCICSRKDIAAALQQQGLARPRHGELVYPGTCRPRVGSPPGTDKPHIGYKNSAWRLRTDLQVKKRPLAPVEYDIAAIKPIANGIQWLDRQLGAQQQDVAREVGDFVLQRSDGCFTYQLAVVVDDAAQGISHVVRGVDLADNTARQILLQRVLGLPTPRYLHTPLVLGSNGEKLSKQNGAQAIDTSSPQAALHALRQAAGALGLAPTPHGGIAEALLAWTDAWQSSHCR
jgi:glutamyl-Q tRNA(Asp) synthetase